MPARKSGVQVKWNGLNYLPSGEYLHMAAGDLAMVMFSTAFVGLWLCSHTESFLIGACGILQIMCTIGSAYFLYV